MGERSYFRLISNICHSSGAILPRALISGESSHSLGYPLLSSVKPEFPGLEKEGLLMSPDYCSHSLFALFQSSTPQSLKQAVFKIEVSK